jgi:GntR family transcriptional regulator, transcriptional repressor for pyruvate dehydrogenase complex
LLSDNLINTFNMPSTSAKNVVSPIARKPALSVAVTDVLREKIESGVWAPGVQVPTEKELSAQLDVSRATIREALTRLKNEGYLHSVQGKGAFVADQPGMGMFKLDMLLSEQPGDSAHIFELRSMVEQNCAALAAERRTTADLREMKRALKAMRDDQAKGGGGLEADIAFHRAIAQAAGNPILARFAEFVGKHAREYLQVVRLSALKSEHRLDDVDHEHQQIIAAIESAKPDAARKAVARHLANGAERFKLDTGNNKSLLKHRE